MAGSVAVAILLRDMPGRVESKECIIDKGNIVVEIQAVQPVSSRHHSPHNYRLNSRPNVTLYAAPTDVCVLHGNEVDYLLAVQPPSARVEYLKQDKMKEKMEIRKDDLVTFKFSEDELDFLIRGKVQYIGPVPESEGIYFGIEILDKKYCGKGTTNGKPHFTCGANNGVYVSIDKIQNVEEKIQQQNSSAAPKSRSNEGAIADHSTSIFQRAKEFVSSAFIKPVIVGEVLPDEDYRYKPGDGVILLSVKRKNIVGTVRWTGHITKDEIQMVVVGIETDWKVVPDRDFLNIHIDVKSSSGQDLFEVSPGHSRVFVPEQSVIPARHYKEPRKEDGHHDARQRSKTLGHLKPKDIASANNLQERIQLMLDAEKRIWDREKKKSEELFQQQISDLERERDDLRKEKDDLANERDDLRRELDDLKREKDETQQRLNDEIDVLKGENKALIVENNNLRQGGQDLQLVETLRAEKRELEEQKQMVEGERDDLRAQLMEMQAMQQDTQELQGQIARLSIENMKLQGELKKNLSWKISREDVKMTKQELGRGGWGVIWVGEFRGQKVAVKQMHDSIVSEKHLELLHREINTMSQLRHPNLVQFIGAVLDDPSGQPLIITEIMDMSLRDAYQKKKQLTPVPVHIPLAVMRDVAVGLNYLHCLPDPIIHRDVSSTNVLLESKDQKRWKTKITDFGSAKFAHAAITKATGAAAYSAPESLQSILDNEEDQPLTPKMDVFSYGVLLCEVLTCQFPNQQEFKAMLSQVCSQHHPYLHDLIKSCIKRNPQDRPNMDQVIQQLDSLHT